MLSIYCKHINKQYQSNNILFFGVKNHSPYSEGTLSSLLWHDSPDSPCKIIKVKYTFICELISWINSCNQDNIYYLFWSLWKLVIKILYVTSEYSEILPSFFVIRRSQNLLVVIPGASDVAFRKIKIRKKEIGFGLRKRTIKIQAAAF